MKKIYIYIIMIVGIVLILTGSILTLTSKKEEPKKEEEKKDEYDPFYEEENKEKTLVFKDVSFINNDPDTHGNFKVHNNKYLIANKKLYDLDGKLIMDFSKYKEVEVKDNKYINADNYIYNFKGELIFDRSKYQKITLSGNYFIVEKDNKSGLFDLTGKEVLTVTYDYIEVESNNCIEIGKVNTGGRTLLYIYNVNKNKTYGPYISIDYYTDDVIVVEKYTGSDIDTIKSSQWFDSNTLVTHVLNINKAKEEKRSDLEEYFFAMDGFVANKYILASKPINWKYLKGALDLNFKTVIPFEYEDINVFEDKYLLLSKDDKHKLTTLDLKTILTFESDETPMFIDIYVNNKVVEIALSNDLYVYYDIKGNLIYKPTTSTYLSYIGDDKYIIEEYENDKCLYLDLNNNNNIKEIDYSFCDFGSSLHETYLSKRTENGEAIYNNKLERISENEYDYLFDTEYFLIAKKNDVYIVITPDEKKLIDKEFKDYDYLSENGFKLIDTDGKIYYLSYE